MAKNAVTLQMIAAHCGQAVSTVSHVLNAGRSDKFRPATVAKIEAAARELGYRRNVSARAMRLGRTDQLALISPNIHSRGILLTQMLDGITDALLGRDPNLRLLLDQITEEQIEGASSLPTLLRDRVVDGALINYHKTLPNEFLNYLIAAGIPTVFLNVKRQYDACYPNDRKAAQDLTHYLHAAGCQRVAYVDLYSPKLRLGHYSRLDRLEGYRRAIIADQRSERRLIFEESYGDTRRPEFPHQAVIDYLRSPDRPDGAVCYNQQSATVLLSAAMRCGLRLPEDLRIACFHSEDMGKDGLPITTSLLPFNEIGRTAVEMLFQKISQPLVNIPSKTLLGRITEPTVLPR